MLPASGGFIPWPKSILFRCDGELCLHLKATTPLLFLLAYHLNLWLQLTYDQTDSKRIYYNNKSPSARLYEGLPIELRQIE
jgi:hypothetical protein